jgi:16S rRNA processing protein RimM
VSSPKLILLGRVAGAFGVRGEVRITAYGEDPLSLLSYKTLVREDGSPVLTLTSGRAAKGGLIARAKEVETREQAEGLRGVRLFVPREILPEPEQDEFYHADLIGLVVETLEGAALGKIKAVQNFGAGDMLEVEPPQGRATFYLPFTREVVPEVRLTEGRVIAVPPAETEDDQGHEEQGLPEDEA